MDEITQSVYEAQKDPDTLNKLIEKYLPFIKSCVARSSIARPSRDDALTLAMLTFADCVKVYETEKGAFIPFVRAAIRNRLIDEYRTRKKYLSLPLLGENGSQWETQLSVDAHQRQLEAAALRMEIEEVTGVLSSWNTSFADLVKVCPKQKRTRTQCQYITTLLITNEEWKQRLLETKRLPGKEICDRYGVSIKILDKYRKYIAALCVIQNGDYPMLQAFLPINRRGGMEDA